MSLQYEIIPVTNLMQNSTLIWDDENSEAIITDVGGDIDKIISVVKKKKLKLKEIWITHGHFDHISGVKDFVDKYDDDVKIMGPGIEDKYWIDGVTQITKMLGMPIGKTFTPDKWLINGDILKVGNFLFEALHCPGHTPGSIVFFSKEEKLLIAGDVIFKDSIGRTDFPGGNYNELISSIKNNIFTLPDDVKIIPGHGPITFVGYERKYNPFLH